MTAVQEQPTKKAKKKAHTGPNGDTFEISGNEAGAEGIELVPPAKPGDADFDWASLYPGEKVFVHTHDGITVGLAAISEKRQPSIGFLRAARKQPEFEQVLDMVEFISCPEALALVDAWVPTDLIAVFEKWSEWNRTAAGE